jgi:hypothetical protein
MSGAKPGHPRVSCTSGTTAGVMRLAPHPRGNCGRQIKIKIVISNGPWFHRPRTLPPDSGGTLPSQGHGKVVK